jgi:type III pantothenate kinase
LNISSHSGQPPVLMIDIGNTNLKWAWLRDGQVSGIRSSSHRQQDPAKLAKACWGQSPSAERVVMANVASRLLGEGITEWITESWGIDVEVVQTSATAFGVTNAYAIPENLGVDRWLTLLAVHNENPAAVCIVDCGTAITIDVMDNNGHHLGGLILPGFDLMREALLDQTHIPRVGRMESIDILGTDTAGAVSSASVHAAAALIDRVMERISHRLGVRPALVLTGSDATRLETALAIPCKVSLDLVMKGLSLFAMEPKT